MSRFPLNMMVIPLSVILFAKGCATLVSPDPDSPYSRVPEGSELDIRRTIEVPPGRTRVFFQAGRETANFDHYVPNCNIEVDRLDYESVQYVAPGVYRIRRVQRHMEEIVTIDYPQVAALGVELADLGGDDGGDIMIYDGYHLWLEGADPNLMRLTCRGVLADPVDARPPSVNQIHAALGESMSLRLTGE